METIPCVTFALLPKATRHASSRRPGTQRRGSKSGSQINRGMKPCRQVPDHHHVWHAYPACICSGSCCVGCTRASWGSWRTGLATSFGKPLALAALGAL
eukprot:12212149-Alexandrium_andersonii.AAC.1